MSNIVTIMFDKIMAARKKPDGQHKSCYGLCEKCVWKFNNGCSEWNHREDSRTKKKED